MSLNKLLQQHEIKRFVILFGFILSIILFVWSFIELQFTLLEVVLLLYVAVDLFEEQIVDLLSILAEVL